MVDLIYYTSDMHFNHPRRQSSIFYRISEITYDKLVIKVPLSMTGVMLYLQHHGVMDNPRHFLQYCC